VLKGRISGGSSNTGRRAVGGPDGIGLRTAERFFPRSCSLSDFRLESEWDVGLFEILPFEEESLAGDLGERIGEAVAEIQPGRVAALAKVEEGLARDVRLLDGERFDDDVSSAEKNITLTAGVWPNLAFNDDGELKEVCGAHQTMVGVVDELNVEGGVGFPKKDGGERGSVQDHLGRPRSS